MMEGRTNDEIAEEWKAKVLPTYLIATVFWIPAQIINFKIVPTQYRVAYVATLTLLEFNILCIIRRRYSSQQIIQSLQHFGFNCENLITSDEPTKQTKDSDASHKNSNTEINKQHTASTDDGMTIDKETK